MFDQNGFCDDGAHSAGASVRSMVNRWRMSNVASLLNPRIFSRIWNPPGTVSSAAHLKQLPSLPNQFTGSANSIEWPAESNFKKNLRY